MQQLSCVLLVLLLSACDALNTQTTTTPSPIAINKLIATVYISPTPNVAQRAATQLAVTPTPATPTATVPASATPYVGVFIGQAQRDPGFAVIEAPFFGPTPGGAPTAVAERCPTPIDQTYLALWQTSTQINAEMGCPIQAGFGFFGQVQFFEDGVMYYRPETREVWALQPSGNTGEYWFVAAPQEQSTAAIEPQPGFIVPEGDYANAWLGIEGLQAEFGYAIDDPTRIALGAQRFDGGTFLLDANGDQIFVLLVDGSALGPYPAPEQ
jgi:hypothetical protein